MKPGSFGEQPRSRVLVLEGGGEFEIVRRVLSEALLAGSPGVEVPSAQRRMVVELGVGIEVDKRCGGAVGKIGFPVAGLVLRALQWYTDQSPSSDPELASAAKSMLDEYDMAGRQN